MSEDKKNGKQNKTVKPFDPMTLRGVTVRNRIWLPPMDTYSALAQDGKPTPFHYQHYVSRAMGGFGMIIMEATAVAPEGRISPCDLGLWDDGQMDAWRWIVADAKAAGATMAVQLNHAGRKGSTGCHAIGFDGQSVPEEQGGWRTVCPSANAYGSLARPRALSVDEIHTIVDQFRDAAWRAMNIGFDAVEVHAAHGYLLSQFLDPLINERDDEYGGSFENRYRFAVEIVQEIKKLCGKDFPVSLRYSVVSKTKDFFKGAVPGEEFKEFGRDMAESEIAAKFLQDAGYDMLNCDNGTYDAWYWAHPPVYMPENCNLAEVEHIKNFVDIPVVCAGRMTLDAAAEAVAAGKLDGAGFARNFLADPEWFTKVLEDREADIRPCILCHNGCFNMCHYKGVPNDQDLSDSLHLARCAVNAEMMQWDKHYIKKTNEPKTVHIVGGGIGGMEAARVLTLRGHKPIIYEKSGVLGGTFIAASSESYKGKLRDLLTWYRREMEKLGVEVRLNTEVKEIESFGSDPVIIATGSTIMAFAEKIVPKGTLNVPARA